MEISSFFNKTRNENDYIIITNDTKNSNPKPVVASETSTISNQVSTYLLTTIFSNNFIRNNL